MLKRDVKAFCGSAALHALLLLLLFLLPTSRIRPFPLPVGKGVLKLPGGSSRPPPKTAVSAPLETPAEQPLHPQLNRPDEPQLPLGPARAPMPNRTLSRRRPLTTPPRSAWGTTRASTALRTPTEAAVPVGNTTIGPPAETLPDPQPLPPPPEDMEPSFYPTSPLDLSEEALMIGRTCDIPNELYPEEARQHSQEGITQLRLTVDAWGQVRGARLLRRAGEPLDEMARSWAQSHCRFQPARDRSGRPTASLVTFTYEWRILGKEPPFLP
ncbi:MAG TPA: energy transducer TonB [Polyangia bacterium]|nr:energy transducer TonB [Polyangia bacterium]